MAKKLSSLVLLLVGFLGHAQFECPTLNNPSNGDIDVPVDATITWGEVDGTNGYLISLGTSPGAVDIVDSRPVSSASFTPELGLPENTNIYVTITLFFFNDDNIECPSEMFRTQDVTALPLCIDEIMPMSGATDVDILPTLSWGYVSTATGYRLSIGTAANNYDILDDLLIENALTYEITEEFPFETEVFVRIIPTNENGTPQNCQEFNFTTQAEAFLPGCTQLTSPADGEVNVPLTPLLEWDAVSGADGYRVSIGTNATESNIVENGAYENNAVEVIDFSPNRTFYVTITPFNQAGDAIGCTQTSFTTILGCGPIEDPVTGEVVSFSPQIDFPSEVALCLTEDVTIISSDNVADGHRWYKVNADGSETLLSETENLSLKELGTYRYEAYNLVAQLGSTYECSSSKTFFAITSELSTITNVDIVENNDSLKITVTVSGIGDYEYGINTIDGPYQNSNVFNSIALGSHTVYVRDKNGCGIAEEKIFGGLTAEGFPLFFTPNGDGINDFWQFDPPQESAKEIVDVIYIFDRYGILMKQLEPDSKGWDGNINGEPLPESDYWFKAIALNKKEVNGHFSLKR